MTSAARAGRRRRLLHDGTTPGATTEADNPAAASAARYAPKDGSASYAVASRVLPHGLAAISAAFCLFALMLGGLIALDGVAMTTSGAPTRLLSLQGPASLAGWWHATLWLAVGGIAAVMFGLRRSRMDDLRCGYRWWAVGAAVGVVMSACSATDAHAWAASYLAGWSGFSPLPGYSFWWLLPGVVVLGFLAIRLVVDASESGAAVFFGCVAIAVTAVGWASDAGLVPQTVRAASPWLAASILGPAASIAGLSFAVCSMLCLARGIVRDAQGVAPAAAPRTETRSEPKPAPAAPKRREKAAKKATPAKPAKAETPAAKETPTRRKQAKPAEPTVWVGGGDDYQEEYDDQPQSRRLSKAERKRLRKQKARRAA